MRSAMSLQLVRARELFATKQPIAYERPLARVPAEMSSQMRCLAIDLAASRHMANVLLLLRFTVAAIAISTIGAGACDTA